MYHSIKHFLSPNANIIQLYAECVNLSGKNCVQLYFFTLTELKTIWYNKLCREGKMYSIGIDIGGTYVKCGIVKNGELVARDKIPTEKGNNEKKIILGIEGLIDSLLDTLKAGKEDIDNIGIGMAGSAKNGVCVFMPNASWRNVHLGKLLKAKYNCQTHVVNDLKAATLGELHFGIGKKCDDFVFVGLGTGLNCGVVKGGKYIIDGLEFGHTIVDMGGVPCGCGKNGCLETMVSTKSLLAYAKKYDINAPTTVKELFEKAKTDKNCDKAIKDYLHALNIGLVNICNSYRPKVIVLGGGIGEGLREKYIDLVNKNLKASGYGYPGSIETKVVCSKVGNNCGILGSSTLKD